MRLRDLTHVYERDPLLKVGVGAMFVALGFAVVVAVASSLDRPLKVAVAETEAKSDPEPLVRSDPGVDPWIERDIPPPKKVAQVEQRAAPSPAPQPDPPPPQPAPEPALPPAQVVGQQPVSVPKPEQRPEPDPGPKPDRAPESQPELNRALPTREQIEEANQPRQYRLPPGAIMSLTIPAIGLQNVPILNSETTGALDRGVVHLPDTSLPWSDTPQTNVYLAGHRLGWAGTGSHLVFYRLEELDGGERITLRDRGGESYDYRVLESFVVWPEERWVTGRVKGRELVTLQTCTPIPTFQKRLIVRAERI